MAWSQPSRQGQAMTVVTAGKRQSSWDEYVGWFHDRRAGSTEEVLSRSFAEDFGSNPYRWLEEAVPSRGWVLDLACGSGPLIGAGSERQWAGVDRSAAELALAAVKGRLPWPVPT